MTEKVKITEDEAVKLKNYIGKYCRNQKDVEYIFNELVGNGHTNVNDPFIKYMVPIIESRIRIEEYLQLLNTLTESIEYLSLREFEEKQEIIIKKINAIETILLKDNIKGEKRKGIKEEQGLVGIGIATIIAISLLVGVLWQQVKNSQNFQKHHQNLSIHETFHK